MRINQNNNPQHPNFTSIIKTKVFIDGLQTIETENLRKGLREVQSILINPANGNERLKGIKKEFSNHVQDLNYHGEKVKIGEIIRNIVDEKKGLGYFFTGIHAQKLNETGKKIGPKKHEALSILGNAKSYEANLAAKKYFDQIRKFVSFSKATVKESINPQNLSYEGDELILNIYAKSTKNKNNNLKLEIDKIVFSKQNDKVTESTPVKPKIEQTTTQNEIKKTKTPKKFNDRYKRINKTTTDNTQGTLFP